MRSGEQETLYPHDYWNLVEAGVLQQCKESDFYLTLQQSLPKIEQQLGQILDIEHHELPSMHALYDELAARMIYDHHIPEGMTAELLTDIGQYVVKSSFGPFCSSQEVLQVGFGHFLAELQYLFTSIANKERQQSLFIYSAHYSTIASLLCACGILLENWAISGSLNALQA